MSGATLSSGSPDKEVTGFLFRVNIKSKSKFCIVNERGLFIETTSSAQKYMHAIIWGVAFVALLIVLSVDPSFMFNASPWLYVIYPIWIIVPSGLSLYFYRIDRKVAMQFMNNSKISEPLISWNQISKGRIRGNQLELETATEHGSITTRLNRNAKNAEIF